MGQRIPYKYSRAKTWLENVPGGIIRPDKSFEDTVKPLYNEHYRDPPKSVH